LLLFNLQKIKTVINSSNSSEIFRFMSGEKKATTLHANLNQFRDNIRL